MTGILFAFFFSLVFLLPLSGFCQAPVDSIGTIPWKKGGTGSINFSQVSLNNWAAGGQNTLSLLGIANLFYNYKQGNRNWDNALDLTYGLLKAQNEPLQKSDDRIDLNSKYGRRASANWNYTAQLNFRSQLTPTLLPNGEKLVSRFLAPAYILSSVGMDYKPSDRFSILLSPFTGKFTVVRDEGLSDLGSFGVRPARTDALGQPVPGTGQRVRGEVGAFLNGRFRQEIMQNITLNTKLDLFSNYLKKPQNVDVNLENLLNLKVNEYVSVSLFLHLIYDDDIDIPFDRNGDGTTDAKGPRMQLKETFGVGLSYNF
jgi:hypothetical protein